MRRLSNANSGEWRRCLRMTIKRGACFDAGALPKNEKEIIEAWSIALLQSRHRLLCRDRFSGTTEAGFRGFCGADDDKKMGSLRVGAKTDAIA